LQRAVYTYKGGLLASIADRNNSPVYFFNYNNHGKIIRVHDQHNRHVGYAWDKDNLVSVTDVLGHVFRYNYSPEGLLTSKSDETGRKFFITYYKNGGVKSVLSREGGGKRFSYGHKDGSWHAKVVSSMGKVREYWFDDQGETERIKENGHTIRQEELRPGGRTTIDEVGNRIVKTYDSHDNLIKEEFADGTSVSYSYDEHNDLLSKTSELGVETRYSYDSRGLMVKVREAYRTSDEQVTDFAYDRDGNRISATTYRDGKAIVTRFAYDKVDNLISVTDAAGAKSKYAYDYMGNVTKATDPAGLATTMGYDAKGELIKKTSPTGRSISFTYDAAGRRTALIDSAGGTTTFVYDYQDNPVMVKDALGGVVKYSYDKDNRLTKRIDQEGRYTVYFYDTGGDLVSKIIDGNGNAIKVTYRGYDDCGSCPKTYGDKPVRIEYPTFTRVYDYDLRGRLKEKTDIAGDTRSTETYTYDKGGRLIAYTDANNRLTRLQYNDLDRLIASTDPLGGVTRFAYDQLGDVTSVIDAKGQETRFAYDATGRKIEELRPSGSRLSYRYDASGRLVERMDAEGRQVTYLYNDSSGYLDGYMVKKGRDSAPGQSVHFSYDKQGNLAGYDDGITRGSYAYDLLGRMTREQVNYGAFTASDSSTYYANGLTKSFTGPDNLPATYRYNAINRLSEIVIDTVGAITFSDYKWLQPRQINLPGIKQLDRYDGLLRLIGRTSKTDTASVLDLSYRYNAAGNIVHRQSGKESHAYSYDNLQRLTGVAKDGKPSEEFSYDPVGNRLTSNKTSYSYENGNQLSTVDGTRYGYDKNGNTISKVSNHEQTNFGYDLEDRLSQVTRNGVTAHYLYDPFGRRIAKEVNGKKTWYFYSEQGLTAEFNAEGKLTASYAYKPDSPWTTDPLMLTRDGKHYFYQNDNLGTPQRLIDSQSKVVWQASYDPFGGAHIVTEQVTNNLRLPGQYFDAETGLYYNWHRFYDPVTGRYVSADPIGLDGGINLYAYVGGDPVNWQDPAGLVGVAVNFGGAYGTGWGGPVNPNSNILQGAGAGTGIYIGVNTDHHDYGYAELGGFTYQSIMSNSGRTPGAAIGLGADLTFYFINANKFFPGRMKYKTWVLFFIGGTVYRDPCTDKVTGVSINLWSKGIGWQWGTEGVSNGIQGVLQ